MDISNEKALKWYLTDRQIIQPGEPCEIRYCSGGVSCTVVFVERKERPLIVKQALTRLKVREEWLCDASRMSVEYECNRVYHQLVPEAVPEAYCYDPESFIYVREAIPQSCSTWKEDLMSGLLDFTVARKAVEALVTVHNRCAGQPEIAARFGDKATFYNLRIAPYLEFPLQKHPDLSRYSEETGQMLMDASITLVHGDFSPKNIMVIGREIGILDYEVAHYGHPAFDLAFFSNHFILKAVKMRAFAPALLSMLRYIVGIYFDQMRFIDKAQMEPAFIRTLALLMIARIDGKSPAEYIVEPEDKRLVLRIAHRIIEEGIATFEPVERMLAEMIV